MSLAEGLAARGRRRRVTTDGSSYGRLQQEAKRGLYHCDYCRKDISNLVRIKCADCPDFDLCLECFSVGVEQGQHKNDHKYRVVDNLTFPLLDPDWGADEELLLLEAIDMFGLGNWAAISEHVGTKTKEQCQLHYFLIYIEPDSCPLPTPLPELQGVDLVALAQEVRQGRGRKRIRLDPRLMPALQQQLPQQQQQPDEKQDGDTPSGSTALESGPLAGPSVFGSSLSEGLGNGRTPSEVAIDMPAQQQTVGKTEPAVSQPAAAVTIAGHVAEAGAADSGAGGGAAAGAGGEPRLDAAAGVAGHQEGGKGLSSRRAAKRSSAGLGEEGAKQGPRAMKGGRGVGMPPDAAAVSQPVEGGGRSLAADPAAAVAGMEAGGAAAAQEEEHVKIKGSGPQLDNSTGWHHKRYEFEPEWDNEAEMAIAELEFRPDDPPEETAAKLRMLELYNKRLDERERRQAAILEYGLLNVRRMHGLERKRLPQEREQYGRLRVFARFQPPGAHEALVDGLFTETRLRTRIQELQAYRAAGLRTFAEADDWEQQRHRQGGSSRGATSLIGSRGDEGFAPGIAAGASFRNPGAALQAWRSRRGVGLDICCQPGLQQLSRAERELCAQLRLLPAHYLCLKDHLMRDAAQHGYISRQDARTAFRLDSGKAQRIYDLLMAHGWLPPPPGREGPSASSSSMDVMGAAAGEQEGSADEQQGTGAAAVAMAGGAE